MRCVVSSDSFVVVDDDEHHHDGGEGLPGFARTFWLSESKIDELGLRIADGLVRLRTVYVEHPIRSGFLLPLAGYHRFVFEDKAMQAIAVAAALGAHRVEAEHVTGWGADLTSHFGAELVEDGRFVLGAEFRQPFSPPSDDDFVAWASELFEQHPWIAYERSWQAMVNGRSEGTMSSVVLPITYESNHGIDLEAIEAAEAAGLSAGGSYTPFERTTWRLHVSFSA